MARPKSTVEGYISTRYKINEVTGCWEWTGPLHSNGYGRPTTPHSHLGCAHKLAYLTWRGPVEKGLLVCHRCDNRKCINPDHLFLGTNSDNMKDCFNKGRGWRPDIKGEKNVNSIVTEMQVRVIRKLKGKISLNEIGKIFGIGKAGVCHIMAKRSWSHV